VFILIGREEAIQILRESFVKVSKLAIFELPVSVDLNIHTRVTVLSRTTLSNIANFYYLFLPVMINHINYGNLILQNTKISEDLKMCDTKSESLTVQLSVELF